MLRALRLARIAAVWALLGACAGMLLAVAGPLALGARPYTVMSGSMEPAIRTGDVVVVESVRPTEVDVGEVVTFPDPSGSDRLITHRLRGRRIGNREALFVTKGDANNDDERWSVPADGRIGRVVYRLPKLGHVAFAASTPLGRLLIIVTVILLGVWQIVRIWRPADEILSSAAAADGSRRAG